MKLNIPSNFVERSKRIVELISLMQAANSVRQKAGQKGQ